MGRKKSRYLSESAFPDDSQEVKVSGPGTGVGKDSKSPVNLLMLNQNTPVHCNPLDNLLNLSMFQLENLIPINVS